MSLAILLNILSIFTIIIFFPELIFLDVIMDEQDKKRAKWIIIVFGLLVLPANIARLFWGESSLSQGLIAVSFSVTLAIFGIFCLNSYNWFKEYIEGKRDIKKDKKDYFIFT